MATHKNNGKNNGHPSFVSCSALFVVVHNAKFNMAIGYFIES